MTSSGTSDRAGRGTRIAARGAAAVVATVAGAASFEHIASVAIGAGERAWVAYSLPAAIDGLIVVGVTALIEDRRQNRKPRPVARLAVLVGVVATLAANLASAEPTWTARLVALAAPVAFLLSVEVLTRTGRALSTPDDTTPPAASPQPATAPATRPAAQPAAAPAAAPAPRAKPKPAARKRTNAARRVAKAVNANPDATAAEIAARLGVSERTVQRYRPKPPDQADNGDQAAPAGEPGPADLFAGNGLAPVPAEAFTR